MTLGKLGTSSFSKFKVSGKKGISCFVTELADIFIFIFLNVHEYGIHIKYLQVKTR